MRLGGSRSASTQVAPVGKVVLIHDEGIILGIYLWRWYLLSWRCAAQLQRRVNLHFGVTTDLTVAATTGAGGSAGDGGHQNG